MAWEVAAGAAAGIAQGVTGALLGGDSGPQKPYSLPPEYEAQMFQYFADALAHNQFLVDQNRQLYSAYDQRMAAVEGYYKGTMPRADAVRALTDTSQRIAQAFGGSVEDAIANGFLDSDNEEILRGASEEYRMARDVESQDYRDPRLENQLNDQKRQLEQDLARSGVGPAQRAIALQQFDRSAEEQRFTRAEELRTGITQRAGARMSLLSGRMDMGEAAKQGAYARALGGYEAVMGQLGFAREGAMGLGSLAGTRYDAARSAMETERQLVSDPMTYFQNLGQFQFSRRGKQMVESGVRGPGSLYSQTGIPRESMGEYGNSVIRRDRADFGAAYPTRWSGGGQGDYLSRMPNPSGTGRGNFYPTANAGPGGTAYALNRGGYYGAGLMSNINNAGNYRFSRV